MPYLAGYNNIPPGTHSPLKMTSKETLKKPKICGGPDLFEVSWCQFFTKWLFPSLETRDYSFLNFYKQTSKVSCFQLKNEQNQQIYCEVEKKKLPTWSPKIHWFHENKGTQHLLCVGFWKTYLLLRDVFFVLPFSSSTKHFFTSLKLPHFWKTSKVVSTATAKLPLLQKTSEFK